jgi:hypothetical protein
MQKDNNTTERLRKQQKQVKAISVLVLVVAIIGIGWVLFKHPTPRQLKVASLKENWNKLENSARTWKNDAYLTSVTFFMFKRISNSPAMQVMAEFHSLQVPANERVQVTIYDDGTVVNASGNPVTISASDPVFEELLANARGSEEDAIRRSDWSIDSQEALNIFTANSEINECLGSPQSIVSLSLNKTYTDDPAWELSIFECPGYSSDLETYHLNATTGERFDPTTP